jgi:hypothetical protein
MWTSDQITITLEEIDTHEPPVALIKISTPVGDLRLLALIVFEDDTLYMRGAHVEGLYAGACGRAGLNAIGRKLLEVANVSRIVIQGGIRTTGRNAGRRPKIICFLDV